MRFWQIMSIFRDDLDSLEVVFRQEEEALYLTWFRNFGENVRSQNRQILDSVVPDKIVRRAMHASKIRFYIDGDFLRVSPSKWTAKTQLDALEVYTKYGGDAIEATLEYGSFHLPDEQC